MSEAINAIERVKEYNKHLEEISEVAAKKEVLENLSLISEICIDKECDECGIFCLFSTIRSLLEKWQPKE